MKTSLAISVFALSVMWGRSHGESKWKIAATQNTIEGYAKFLTEYPEGPYSAEAQKRLDLLKAEERDWVAAHQGDPIESYGEFVQKHLKSRHSEEILKLTDAAVRRAVQHLAGRFEIWDDADRNVEDSILRIDPNNPYALSLLAFDRVRKGQSDSSRDLFAKAVANCKDERVSDISKTCVVPGQVRFSVDQPLSRSAHPFRVAQPEWKGPEADAERKKIVARSKSGPDLIPIPIGKCASFLLFSEASEDPKSEKRTLRYWIEGWLRATSEPGPADVASFLSST